MHVVPYGAVSARLMGEALQSKRLHINYTLCGIYDIHELGETYRTVSV